ncbi:MAG: chaperone NapD [Candidatus Accumulibacter phosphatis]|uniref:chaperone NapD n=1 Tax=Candidatus Accumulibacter phosphatis TaxID=327160 RepID=UPI001A4B9556|nr:chaperone NapD [Candidatus Accumulibacter phosphatis]
MNISSVLVNARHEAITRVKASLCALGGVEVHVVTESGQMIVTIEADSDQAVANLFARINEQPGVLSASMVYHQFEPDPDEEA